MYTFIAQTFSFLTDLESSEETMSMGVENLIEAYPEDVDETFLAELRHFHLYVKKKCSEQKKFSHQDLCTVIFEDKVQSLFPNVESVLRLPQFDVNKLFW